MKKIQHNTPSNNKYKNEALHPEPAQIATLRPQTWNPLNSLEFRFPTLIFPNYSSSNLYKGRFTVSRLRNIVSGYVSSWVSSNSTPCNKVIDTDVKGGNPTTGSVFTFHGREIIAVSLVPIDVRKHFYDRVDKFLTVQRLESHVFVIHVELHLRHRRCI